MHISQRKIDTGLYYCQSRYYNPEWGRWLNADEVFDEGSGLLEGNLFAYCANNPVNYSDPDGHVVTPANVIGAVIGGVLGAVGGYFLTRYLSDRLGLKGWKRTAFIGGLTVAITAGACAIGYFMGPYVGKVLGALYAKSAALAGALNRAIATVIAKLMHGSITAAKDGWIIRIGKVVVRIMNSGGIRNNYVRISVLNKGALTLAGLFSDNRALTHINITITNIIKIIKLITQFK